MRVFSPPDFSSTASSSTMFRNTCKKKRVSGECVWGEGERERGGYVVAAEDADDFAGAVELHEEALVEVLGGVGWC